MMRHLKRLHRWTNFDMLGSHSCTTATGFVCILNSSRYRSVTCALRKVWNDDRGGYKREKREEREQQQTRSYARIRRWYAKSQFALEEILLYFPQFCIQNASHFCLFSNKNGQCKQTFWWIGNIASPNGSRTHTNFYHWPNHSKVNNLWKANCEVRKQKETQTYDERRKKSVSICMVRFIVICCFEMKGKSVCIAADHIVWKSFHLVLFMSHFSQNSLNW